MWRRVVLTLFFLGAHVGSSFCSIPDISKEEVNTVEISSYYMMRMEMWIVEVWMTSIRFNTFYRYGMVILPTQEEMPSTLDLSNPLLR